MTGLKVGPGDLYSEELLGCCHEVEHCFVPVLAGGRVSDKVKPPQSGQFHHVGVVAFVCRNKGIRGRKFLAQDVNHAWVDCDGVMVKIGRLHLIQLVSVPVFGEVHLACYFAGLEGLPEGAHCVVLHPGPLNMFGEGRNMVMNPVRRTSRLLGRQPSTAGSSRAFHKGTCCALCP